MRTAPRGVLVVLCAMLGIAGSGCGYSLAGRGSFLPSYIRTIGVPQFVNNTPIFELDRRVTDRVRSELLGRGKYKVLPDETGTDAVMTGELSSLPISAVTFN